MPTRRRAILILSALCLLAVGSFMLALMVGSFKVAAGLMCWLRC